MLQRLECSDVKSLAIEEISDAPLLSRRRPSDGDLPELFGV
jgi:hypothetical protein